MATFSQIYVHLIFSVKRRAKLISPSWEEELYKYITGIVQNKGQKMLAINGMPEHLHLLIEMKPSGVISDLVREIKKSTNSWIKDKKFIRGKFQWAEGFGAFSYSNSALNNVISYIQNQKEHHRKKSFKEEFVDFLKEFEVDYKEEYLFKD